jgi:hypothetical protein
VSERWSLQLTVDRHLVMLQDLKDAADQRVARMEELTDDMAHTVELPAEEYMRLHEIVPKPTSIETYIKLHAERMTRWATSRAWTGSCRVSEIVSLRSAMVDLVAQRAQRTARRDPAVPLAQLAREAELQQNAESGITLLIRVELDERDECRRWARHAAVRAELLGWQLLGSALPDRKRTMTTEVATLKREQTGYDIAREHQQTAEALPI